VQREKCACSQTLFIDLRPSSSTEPDTELSAVFPRLDGDLEQLYSESALEEDVGRWRDLPVVFGKAPLHAVLLLLLNAQFTHVLHRSRPPTRVAHVVVRHALESETVHLGE